MMEVASSLLPQLNHGTSSHTSTTACKLCEISNELAKAPVEISTVVCEQFLKISQSLFIASTSTHKLNPLVKRN